MNRLLRFILGIKTDNQLKAYQDFKQAHYYSIRLSPQGHASMVTALLEDFSMFIHKDCTVQYTRASNVKDLIVKISWRLKTLMFWKASKYGNWWI